MLNDTNVIFQKGYIEFFLDLAGCLQKRKFTLFVQNVTEQKTVALHIMKKTAD